MAIDGLANCGRDLLQQWQLSDLTVGWSVDAVRVSK